MGSSFSAPNPNAAATTRLLTVSSLPPLTCPHCGLHYPNGAPDSRWTCNGIGSSSSPSSGNYPTKKKPCGKSMWAADKPNCELCSAELGRFFFGASPHHCRLDGVSVCDSCSAEKATFTCWKTPQQQQPVIERLCKRCSLRLRLRQSYSDAFVENLKDVATVKQDSLYVNLRIQRDVNAHNLNEQQSAHNNQNNNQLNINNSVSNMLAATGEVDDTSGERICAKLLPDRVKSTTAAVVLVEGAAGSGKSKVAQQLCIEQNFEHAVVIFCELRSLVGNPVSLATVADLLDVFTDGILGTPQRKQIVDDKIPCLWILDGFDELMHSSEPHIVGFLRNFVDPRRRRNSLRDGDLPQLVRPRDLVIVSSREERVSNSNCALDLGPVDRWVILRWNFEETRAFAMKWFSAFPPEPEEEEEGEQVVSKTATPATATTASVITAATNDVVAALRSSEMDAFAGLPLFIFMVCSIRRRRRRDFLATMSPTIVFELFCELTWSRSRKRLHEFHSSLHGKGSTGTGINIMDNQQFADLLASSMRGAARLAFAQFTSPSVHNLTSIRLPSSASEEPPLWVRALQVGGMVKCKSDSIVFPHRSFIEFLVARAIALPSAKAVHAIINSDSSLATTNNSSGGDSRDPGERAVSEALKEMVAITEQRSSSSGSDGSSSKKQKSGSSNDDTAGSNSTINNQIGGISWTPKFTTIIVLLADYARRFMAREHLQQQGAATSSSSTSKRLLRPEFRLSPHVFATAISKLYKLNFLAALATHQQQQTRPESDETQQDMRATLGDAVGVRVLLRITTLLPPAVIFGRLEAELGQQQDLAQLSTMLLAEYVAVEGAAGALKYLADALLRDNDDAADNQMNSNNRTSSNANNVSNSNSNVNRNTNSISNSTSAVSAGREVLALAMARALDHQDRESCARCVATLRDVYKINAALESSVRVGSVVGVGRALSGSNWNANSNNSNQKPDMTVFFNLVVQALRSRHFDVVAVLAKHAVRSAIPSGDEKKHLSVLDNRSANVSSKLALLNRSKFGHITRLADLQARDPSIDNPAANATAPTSCLFSTVPRELGAHLAIAVRYALPSDGIQVFSEVAPGQVETVNRETVAAMVNSPRCEPQQQHDRGKDVFVLVPSSSSTRQVLSVLLELQLVSAIEFLDGELRVTAAPIGSSLEVLRLDRGLGDPLVQWIVNRIVSIPSASLKTLEMRYFNLFSGSDGKTMLTRRDAIRIGEQLDGSSITSLILSRIPPRSKRAGADEPQEVSVRDHLLQLLSYFPSLRRLELRSVELETDWQIKFTDVGRPSPRRPDDNFTRSTGGFGLPKRLQSLHLENTTVAPESFLELFGDSLERLDIRGTTGVEAVVADDHTLCNASHPYSLQGRLPALKHLEISVGILDAGVAKQRLFRTVQVKREKAGSEPVWIEIESSKN